MRLRNRLQNQLLERLGLFLPREPQLEWSEADIKCVFENLQLTPEDKTDKDWHQVVSFDGILQVLLPGASIHSLVAEVFINSLINDVLVLQPDESISVGGLSEEARAILTRWSETIDGEQLTTSLYLEVNGYIVQRVELHQRPEVLVGIAPEIGIQHRDKYTPITR